MASAGGVEVGIEAGGGRRDHRRAEQHGVGRLRLDDRAAGGVGIKLHQQRVARVAAGDVQRVDDVAALVQRLEDMAHAERDADAGAPIEPAQAVEGGIERQPADHAERMRVGERRAVAVEIRQHMQAAGEVEPFGRRAARMTRAAIRWCMAASGSPPAPCQRMRWSSSAPVADWPPSLSQSPGSADAEIGPPDAGERAAARGDSAMTQLEVPAISARWRSTVARSPAKPPSTPSAPA